MKLTIREQDDRMVLTLEGKLIGPWTSVVERCWQDTLARTAKLIVVDLNAVTFIDASGKALLAEMHEGGAQLEARGALTAYILEQIRDSAISGVLSYES